MEDGFRLQDATVAIVGLGLMGGSLALALKGNCAALYGIDSDPVTLELARARQIVDQADSDPASLLPDADLVILAAPVTAIIDFIHKLPAFIQRPCIVLDLGSTKREIVRAMTSLPQNFDPIGGHPICGKEKLGLENADASLYEGAAFIVTTLERTSRRALEAAEQLTTAIGAQRVFMSAQEHDHTLASTSHLPFLIASALALSTPLEFAAFLGTGFKSTSRLAGTPSHMMLGVLQSNREHILHALRTFRHSLDQLESAMKDEDYPQLELFLNQARSSHQSLLSNF